MNNESEKCPLCGKTMIVDSCAVECHTPEEQGGGGHYVRRLSDGRIKMRIVNPWMVIHITGEGVYSISTFLDMQENAMWCRRDRQGE